MASTPFRRRGKMAKAARTARNLALADAAIALARDRVGSSSRSRRPSGRTLMLGGAAVAVAAGVLWKRDKVAGVLPSRTGGYEPPAPPVTPGPSNYDASGPIANTATPVPAPDPQQAGTIDESAEEAAAAAEAANIGGPVSDYAGPADLPATEAERPLAEAGQGEAEGQEQAELGLEQAAQPTAPGMSDTERQIEDTIEAAANPAIGEDVEAVRPIEDAPGDAEERVHDEPAPFLPPTSEQAAAPAESPAPTSEPEDEPAAPAESSPARDEPAPSESPAARDEPGSGGGYEDSPATPASDEKPPDEDDGGSDWRTWSGRSVNP
jgi:hypothetical protein